MRVLCAAVLLCACGGKPSSSGDGKTGDPAECAAVRGKIEQLYRAEAQTRDPKRVEEAVSDNTTMVMNDCARAPARVSACVRAASTVPGVEKCLAPLDDEGTDGEELKR